MANKMLWNSLDASRSSSVAATVLRPAPAWARWLIKEGAYWRATIEGRLGGAVDGVGPHRATLIIPSYHARRARNLQPIVSNALRCAFIDRVVISNHNPLVRAEDWVRRDGNRVQLINQPERRGCGYGWIVASQIRSDYYLVVDDDTILTPQQLRTLFLSLLDDPAVPHGVAGWQSHGQFVERREADVECLFNAYAVTRHHIDAYVEYFTHLLDRGVPADTIEFYADDIVISQTGDREARAHDVGWVLRCWTSNETGVAISQDREFWPRRERVLRALKEIKAGRSDSAA